MAVLKKECEDWRTDDDNSNVVFQMDDIITFLNATTDTLSCYRPWFKRTGIWPVQKLIFSPRIDTAKKTISHINMLESIRLEAKLRRIFGAIMDPNTRTAPCRSLALELRKFPVLRRDLYLRTGVYLERDHVPRNEAWMAQRWCEVLNLPPAPEGVKKKRLAEWKLIMIRHVRTAGWPRGSTPWCALMRSL